MGSRCSPGRHPCWCWHVCSRFRGSWCWIVGQLSLCGAARLSRLLVRCLLLCARRVASRCGGNRFHHTHRSLVFLKRGCLGGDGVAALTVFMVVVVRGYHKSHVVEP